MGVTRSLIIKLAHKKYQVEERPVFIKETNKADEAFITGTTQGVVPVVKIDRKKVGSGNPGLVTKNLEIIFNKYVQEFSGKSQAGKK
jgi:branched-subunit amino acid aminotransferase/4-amino-4-deoxychorismate lyase